MGPCGQYFGNRPITYPTGAVGQCGRRRLGADVDGKSGENYMKSGHFRLNYIVGYGVQWRTACRRRLAATVHHDGKDVTGCDMQCVPGATSQPAGDRKIGPLWMRSIRFAGLARVLHLFRERHAEFKAKDLNIRIINTGAYRTERCTRPSATTLYHCRNTLLQIGALTKADGHYRLAERPEIETILSNTKPNTEKLNWEACNAFADLVLQNADCQAAFFSLFSPRGWLTTAAEFRGRAIPVSWKATLREGGRDRLGVILESEGSGEHGVPPTKRVTTGDNGSQDICSILYGVRYWALDDLRLIDECFSLDRGSTMFPIKAESEEAAAEAIMEEIIKSISDERTWTTLSIQGLIQQFCVGQRRRIVSLYSAIKKIAASAPGKVVLIPTAEGFASNTLSATFPGTRKHELAGYYRDGSGRLISHIRLHVSIARMNYAQSA